MEKPDVLLLGHSYIRRYRDSLITRENGRNRGRDISQSRPHIAILAASKANLAKDISGLYTASQGINLMDDLWRTESSINAIRPAIVALHIGSNDLSNLTSINGETAKWLARRGLDFANYICTQYGVVKVLMFSTLPRTAGLSCTPEEFRENMGTFNKEIEIHCDNNRLNYVHVRGFYCTKINNLDVPRPVRDWSGDGIHCDMEKSKKKYAQRVRFAIMNASSAIQ